MKKEKIEMGVYIRFKDAPEGKLTINTTRAAVVFLDGGAMVDEAVFNELKDYGFAVEKDMAKTKKIQAAAKEQYSEGKEDAEKLTDAVVEQGVDPTGPVELDPDKAAKKAADRAKAEPDAADDSDQPHAADHSVTDTQKIQAKK
jgi:hypothetical protein